MKFSKLNIDGVIHNVRWYSEREMTLNERYGYYDSAEAEIGICESVSPSRQCEIFLHEITHAIEQSRNIFEFLESEESRIKNYSSGINSIFQNNPKAAKWYFENLNKE